ncbi:MAG: helix-turn-helix transcriptional regulator [Anaerolineae bacterium]|nr:helix-turn-helix transcriptional regulator [Anaerolineae bacterium]
MFRELMLGLIRIHILHHAAEGPVYGVWLMEELRRHGYELSPGTLYPILHSLERQGYLASERRVVGGRVRRYYTLTPRGRQALEESRARVRELAREILGGAAHG